MNFYFRAGKFIAWTLVILGAFRALMALGIAVFVRDDAQMIAYSKRYLATSSTGPAIDQGLKLFAAGIVLGLLVTIAKRIGR